MGLPKIWYLFIIVSWLVATVAAIHDNRKRLKLLLTNLETLRGRGQVPMEGLEPSTLAGLVFETSAYTGSATSACIASIASIIIAHH